MIDCWQGFVIDRAHVGGAHVEAIQARDGRDLRLDLVAVNVRVAGRASADAKQFTA
jgi:hypothetical protein